VITFDNTKKYNKLKMNNGFTVVELLIVVVVIGILAGITIVAYNGVQTRAKTAQAQTSATSAVKKTEVFNAEKSSYPVISTDLTGAGAVGTTYLLTGVTFVAAMGTTPPATPSSLTFYKCGTGATTAAPTTVAGITTITGSRIDYFNFTTTSTASMSGGVTSGVIATYNIGCVINN
jgi:prepilin-type N-terminal cleavage/methylation domain-containing protein